MSAPIMPAAALPFGLRDVKIKPYTNTTLTTVGAGIDLPYARTFSFTETEDFEELRGDDKLIAVRGTGSGVDWELEAGGLSFAAMAAMYGGTVTETGTTPDRKRTWLKKTTDARPYFAVEGQAISDSGGDVHCILDRCRATDDMEGELGDGSFWLSSGSGRALPSMQTGREDVIYEFTYNETVTAITA